MEAVRDLDNKKLTEDDTPALYVKAALNKDDRMAEKAKEMIRYKNSKKRCNLYVKNFPPTTTKEELEQHFG